MTASHRLVKCWHCGGKDLHTRQVSSGPSLLRGLRVSLAFARFDVVACGACGKTDLFVEDSARKRLASAKGWHLIGKAT